MNNKSLKGSPYRNLRKGTNNSFAVNFCYPYQVEYSQKFPLTATKLINIDKMKNPSSNIILVSDNAVTDPPTTVARREINSRQLNSTTQSQISKKIANCLTPSKVNIQMQDSQQQFHHPVIHTGWAVQKQMESQRDLLKQYKNIQFMKRQLRKRNQALSLTTHFSVELRRNNTSRNSTTRPDPQKNQIVSQIKQKSPQHRYNKMFTRYMMSASQQLRRQSKLDLGVVRGHTAQRISK